MAKSHQGGFTLIEIAIVLVIIGLLLGGVLKGQELITSARVRNLIAQQDGIKAAFFGAQIAVISTYKGFNTSGGARGVGQAATAAVVLSSVSILVGTYLLTELLGDFLHGWTTFTAVPR